MSEPFTELIVEPGLALAAWRNVALGHFRVGVPLAAMVRYRQMLRTMAIAHPRGIAMLALQEATAAVPDGETRDHLAVTIREHAAVIRCAAIVFEATGFRAAMIRSVVTGLALLARRSYPDLTTQSLDDASRFVARHLDAAGVSGGSGEEIGGAMRSLRARLDAAPP